jgi:uncharacterized protein YbjT (DUF2867 family)
MDVILFGATGMVGQGVLRECLADPGIGRVLAVGRTPLAEQHEKLRQLQVDSFLDFSAVAAELAGYDACFYCLGVSAVGLDEAAYRRVTYDFALAAGATLARLNPGLRFLYISGAGTDPDGAGKVMWARVKGQTEDALLALPFRSAHMLRPGFIRPLDGIRSKTRIYRTIYAILAPFAGLLEVLAPGRLLTTRSLGRAMVRIAREGHPKQRLEVSDLHQLID